MQFALLVQDSHAYCQNEEMVVKARFRKFRVGKTRSCPAGSSTCVFKEMMLTTDKIEVLGELKVSGIIFKEVGIEASFRADMSNEANETSVRRISVPGRNVDKDCVDGMYIAPEIIKNQYIPKDASTSVWVTLNCTESDAVDLVAKRQDAALAPEGDLCYDLDEQDNLVPETCDY
ncbi:hypothetical protein BG011_004047 [Mortierella polycephala]|uniref:Uncharacterized protein n=1 Tax=Mortierella polycephala TaxID=41804 RepID=A0A9P6U378_9FUNG|nr:hypothetical protein BG011_004047 [Mortierella polycephala]